MKQEKIATASPMQLSPQCECRANRTERKSGDRLVLEGGTCKPLVTREPVAPWVPTVGAFVWVDNGWGQRIRARVACVPKGGGLHSFGVRFLAYETTGPLHWLAMGTRGVLWGEGV